MLDVAFKKNLILEDFVPIDPVFHSRRDFSDSDF